MIFGRRNKHCASRRLGFRGVKTAMKAQQDSVTGCLLCSRRIQNDLPKFADMAALATANRVRSARLGAGARAAPVPRPALRLVRSVP